MITKQSISLLVVSTLLVLPGGMAIAGNIDVQTGNMRATIAPNRSVNVKTGQTSATITPKRSPMPNYRRQNGHIRNSQIRYIPATIKPQVQRTRNTCNGGSYSHQSTQTTVSNGGVSRTYSSASTMCR